jgi:very-short-patch-repair endonuclease
VCSELLGKLGGDRAIAELAVKQHGVVTSAQLAAAGLGRGAIRHRLVQSRLHRVHPKVFLVGNGIASPLAREAAALLSCGRNSALSHRPAASICNLLPRLDGDVDVTVVARNPRPRTGIRIHRVRSLDPRDLMRRSGLLLTAPPRTLLDLATVLSERQLERAVEAALRLGLAREKQLRALLGRAGGHQGRGRLRAVLNLQEGPSFTRSEAEERFLALVRAARLPPPQCNVRLGSFEVDFLWRGERLVVEVDGYAFHSTRAAFESDRRRDAELQMKGYSVMRVTWRQIVEEPEALVARLAQRLSSGQWR